VCWRLRPFSGISQKQDLMRLIGYLLALFVFVGCSGAGAGAEGGERVRNTVRASLGTSTASHIISSTDDVLMSRNGYQFERRVETGEDIRLITTWRELPATDDERAMGYGYARVRITLSARPRDRTAGTYSATFNAEVEGRGPTNDIWQKIAVTEERNGYLKDLISTLENEFKGGVR